MNDKNKSIVVEEDSTCFYSGAMPHYDLKAEQNEMPAQTPRKD